MDGLAIGDGVGVGVPDPGEFGRQNDLVFGEWALRLYREEKAG